jgi:hypothetical protein
MPFSSKNLKNLDWKKEWRLACFCKAESDITIEISQFEDIILADNSTFSFHRVKVLELQWIWEPQLW